MTKKKNTGKTPDKKSKNTKKCKKDKDIISQTDVLIKSLIDKEKEIIRTEDALVESMKRFRDIFEQSPIGVGIYDTVGELLVVNNSYLKVFGMDSFNDITRSGLFSDDDISKEDMDRIKKGKVVQYEKTFDFKEVAFKSSREDTGYVLFTVSPLHRDEDIIGYMAHLQDITERKKIEESQRLAQLGRLLSDMAHEVNNPLMIISGKSELALLNNIEDEKLRGTLEVILEQAFFAKDIIQRLLKYSRLGKVEKEPMDIVKVIDLILDIMEHHFKVSGVRVKREIGDKIPDIFGHEKQLQEVFINIIRNATDAMPEGGKLTVKVHSRKKAVKIEIIDTGGGMPKEVLKRIFEPFFTTKQKGTGLGMAVCHTIITDHNGELKYTSKPGKGTKAEIILPAEGH